MSAEPGALVAEADGQIVLVVDGDPGDADAIREAARAAGGRGARLLVLLVPVTVLDWAHLEFGDDPELVRQEIEWDQWRATTRMLDAAGVPAGYRMRRMRSRWAVADVTSTPDGCEALIVSTSSRFVRGRLAILARRSRISLRLLR
ncbi:MAG: hypothetical protein JST08_17350 [Actinobacteria bacterium]|nr:hypothetical protein [Actinomycetota bacterium]